jgi:3'-5' exoribonuclease
MFPEALMLHYLDDLDSKMEAMRAMFERESASESPWTSYNASLGRPLLNTEKFLSPRRVIAPEEPAAVIDAELDSDESSEQTPAVPGVNPRQ